MTEGESAGVERALGRLEGIVGELAKQVAEQGVNSEEGRRRLYDRIDERIGSVDKKIDIVAEVARTAADKAAETEKKLDKEIMPTVNEMNRLKISGKTGLTIIVAVATVVGSFAWWAWDVIVTKITGP